MLPPRTPGTTAALYILVFLDYLAPFALFWTYINIYVKQNIYEL